VLCVPQMLLFPDPQPLVERLGKQFFRDAPECPGVYLMRDASDAVLYVGKAKNLKNRLASYRVANPERTPRRHLRLLRVAERIELRRCADEAEAIATEAGLLRMLRPRFNRAGTWPGVPRFVAWRTNEAGLDLAVLEAKEEDWSAHRTSRTNAILLRACLVRLVWCALYPQRGVSGMPAGWFDGCYGQKLTIPQNQNWSIGLKELSVLLNGLFKGQIGEFTLWVHERTSMLSHPFEIRVIKEALQTVTDYAQAYSTRPISNAWT